MISESYYKAIVIQMPWDWYQARPLGQWNGVDKPAHICTHMTKVQKQFSEERIIKKNNCAGTTGYPYAK